MQLNEAKFLQNGKCGYVLKPSFMLKNTSLESPLQTAEDPLIVVVKVIFCGIKQSPPVHNSNDILMTLRSSLPVT